ncbi:hypothetical protein PR048_012186 [Dryococelus australis]|uniref:HAT C-terminal dimerisation domain-containing protein n=1 Tax=Dryococelus australis TaxID=614101 RepID=A0ABQ9HNW3_9NEOP|nr:hypothetical protein PR048_012186 [Dryococelus australis]
MLGISLNCSPLFSRFMVTSQEMNFRNSSQHCRWKYTMTYQTKLHKKAGRGSTGAYMDSIMRGRGWREGRRGSRRRGASWPKSRSATDDCRNMKNADKLLKYDRLSKDMLAILLVPHINALCELIFSVFRSSINNTNLQNISVLKSTSSQVCHEKCYSEEFLKKAKRATTKFLLRTDMQGTQTDAVEIPVHCYADRTDERDTHTHAVDKVTH